MFQNVETSLRQAEQQFSLANNPRRSELERLGAYLAKKGKDRQAIKLVVICTHNSRRSHLGQFWAQVAATNAGLSLAAFSGGTEATACHPNTLAALERAGASVEKLTEGANPHYRILFGAGEKENIQAWSKHYSDKANPQDGFAALMVCSDADQGCPWVEGAEARFSLPYTDPKHADGSPSEAAAYDEASRIIAGEMAWLVELAKGTQK